MTAFLQGLLTTVYGNIVFSRSKKHAWHKRLVFFYRFSICCCSLRLYKALGGIGRLGTFGRFWRVLLALQSVVRLWEALSGGLERLRKVLGGFVT